MRKASNLVRAMSTASPSSRNITYPKWTGPSQCSTPVVTRPAIPLSLRPPPTSKCPNTLPPRPPTPSPRNFKSSRHIIPAAFPRTYKESLGDLERGSNPFTKTAITRGEGNEERKKRNLGEAKECVKARFNATATSGAEKDVSGLWIAGERWIRQDTERKGEGEGLTLVLSAANGFTKEVRSFPTRSQSDQIELDANRSSSSLIYKQSRRIR